jgi:hypothetical protein
MTKRKSTHTTTTCNFPIAASERPIYAFSYNYGFDFEEEEIAHELLVTNPVNQKTWTIPDEEVGEFEKGFLFFFS